MFNLTWVNIKNAWALQENVLVLEFLRFIQVNTYRIASDVFLFAAEHVLVVKVHVTAAPISQSHTFRGARVENLTIRVTRVQWSTFSGASEIFWNRLFFFFAFRVL